MRAVSGYPFRALAAAVINRALQDAEGRIETVSQADDHPSGGGTRKARLRQEAISWLTSPEHHGARAFFGDLAGYSDREIRRACHRLATHST